MKINTFQNTSFKGSLKLLGGTSSIRSSFFNNDTLKKLADSSKYDIVGIIKSKNASNHEKYILGTDEVLFKLTLKAKRPVKSFADKILNFICPSHIINPTRNYHSEETTIRIIDGYNNLEDLKRGLNI